MCFPVNIAKVLRTSFFSPNKEKYGPEITLYLGTFHTVNVFLVKKVNVLLLT